MTGPQYEQILVYFGGILIYEMLIRCVIMLQRSCQAKNWWFKVKKVKIMVLGNPDPYLDKFFPYPDPDPPSG